MEEKDGIPCNWAALASSSSSGVVNTLHSKDVQGVIGTMACLTITTAALPPLVM